MPQVKHTNESVHTTKSWTFGFADYKLKSLADKTRATLSQQAEVLEDRKSRNFVSSTARRSTTGEERTNMASFPVPEALKSPPSGSLLQWTLFRSRVPPTVHCNHFRSCLHSCRKFRADNQANDRARAIPIVCSTASAQFARCLYYSAWAVVELRPPILTWYMAVHSNGQYTVRTCEYF